LNGIISRGEQYLPGPILGLVEVVVLVVVVP